MVTEKAVGRKVEPVIAAIGDINGSYCKLEKLLAGLSNEYGLLEKNNLDIRDGCRLVFLGNYIGYGSEGHPTIEYLRELKKLNNHQLILLLGTTEIMALKTYLEISRLSATNCQNELVKLLFEGKNKEKIFSETNFAQYHGAGSFIMEFDRDFDKALTKYAGTMHKFETSDLDEEEHRNSNVKSCSAGRDGWLREWIESLEPLHRASDFGKSFLFVHGDSFPRKESAKQLRKLIYSYEALEEACRKNGNMEILHEFICNNFHQQTFVKRDYKDSEHAKNFVRETNIDYLITSCSDSKSPDRIRLKHDVIIRMDRGVLYASEPRALIIKSSGAYQFGLHSKEIKILDF